jgi:uncharacterized protein
MQQGSGTMTDVIWRAREKMLELIEEQDRPGRSRDETVNWEKIHMASTSSIAYTLAKRHGIEPTLPAVVGAIHDIGRVMTGEQAGHAERGYQYALDFLRGLLRDDGTQFFSESEIEAAALAVKHHSKKGEVGNPLEELVKDADVLDMYYSGFALPREEQRNRLRGILERGNEVAVI